MADELRALKIVLRATGAIAMVAGVFFIVWPSGFRWHPYHPYYEQMIVGIYFTLGVFLWRAASDPMEHLSLIWFAVWANVVHGVIMAVQALSGAEHHAHLVGDVPILLAFAALLGCLTPRRSKGVPNAGAA